MRFKDHLTSQSWISGCRWVITPSWLFGSWRSFCIVFSVGYYSVRKKKTLPFITTWVELEGTILSSTIHGVAKSWTWVKWLSMHTVTDSEVAQSCLTLCNPLDCSPHASSSMGFFGQEYWSGLSFPSPGDLLDPGIEPRSPKLQTDALTSQPHTHTKWNSLDKHYMLFLNMEKKKKEFLETRKWNRGYQGLGVEKKGKYCSNCTNFQL